MANSDVDIKLGLDSTKAESEVSGALNKIGSKVGSAATKLTASMAAAGVAGVTAIAKSATDAYAQYEQMVGGVETLFKESAGTVEAYAEQAYQTAGVSANKYMEQATSFSAALIQSLDGDTAAAAEYANLAIQDMSDNANKMGTSIESIQMTYQSIMRGNYAMLDNLKLGYGGTKSELERLVADAEELTGQALDPAKFSDIITAIHAVQENLGITGTTAKEASSTIQGSVNTMQAAWENWLTALGRSDVNIGAETEKLVDSVVTVMENVVPRVGQIMGTLVTEIGENGPRIARELWISLKKALPSEARPVMDAIQDIFESGFAEVAAGAAVGISGLGLFSKAADSLSPVLDLASGALGKMSDGLLDLATSPATASTALGGLAEKLLAIPTPAAAIAAVVGGALVTALGAMAVESAEAEKRQQLLADATESASDIFSSATTPMDDYGDSISDMRSEAEDALQSLADLNAEVGGDLRDAFADTATVDGYVDTINELANKSGLSATEQYKLKEAVDGYNSVVGTQYSVVDAANGVIADQNGVIQENTDEINANAEAWKNRAVTQALSDASAKYMQEEAEAAFSLQQAQDLLNDSTKRYNDALANYNSITDNGKNPLAEGADDAAQELNSARDAMNNAQSSVNDLTTAYDSASRSAEDFSNMASIVSAVYDTLGDKSNAFVTSLTETGIGLETFTSLTDEQLASIAESWDGSVQSIVDAMARLNIDVPASAYNSMGLFSEAITEGGAAAITAALNVSGMTVQQFASAVSQYGIQGDAAIIAFANAIAAGDSPAVAAQKAKDTASSLGDADFSGQGTNAMSDYADGISAGGDSAETAAAGVAQDAASAMDDVDTYTSGLHLGHNFAAGLIDSKPAVANAAKKISDTVAVQMRFSVPKGGPFSGAEKGGETSGRHLVENFARGMMLAVPDIESAADSVMMAAGLGSVDWGYGMASSLPRQSSTTVIQYITNDNSQSNTFNQPVSTPYETARKLRMQQTYGLAGAR